jgi:hypothetical protein
MISVSTIGVDAEAGFFLRARGFPTRGRGFFISFVLAFLADFFAFLGAARFVAFLATAFLVFRRFADPVFARFFLFAIAPALLAAIGSSDLKSSARFDVLSNTPGDPKTVAC